MPRVLVLALIFGGTLVAAEFRLASFSADITIPLGHRCMGLLPTKSQSVADPLYAHGMVLLSDSQPIVLVALDWCEVRNAAYDQWRDTLAAAAGTVRERVLVCSLHQHDAPVVDREAEDLLAEVGLAGELYDVSFHDDTLRRVARALKDSLADTQPVTHLGLGKAPVKQVASNRRVEINGQVVFRRGSRSGGDSVLRAAAEGEIDPWLKTLSFWNDEMPLMAIHSYATHPMSYYGRGEVSSDFVGLARQKRQRDDSSIHQIYVTGCSGDVTAGKYNDGSPENRAVLRDRVYDAMVAAWGATSRFPLRSVAFRRAALTLPYSDLRELSSQSLYKVLRDSTERVEDRVYAAMGLSSRRRVERGQPIDLPCIDFGFARIVLFPGETFVGFQNQAQQLAGSTFVLPIGYGECWPGYIPTVSALADGFEDRWMWVGHGAAAELEAALRGISQR